MYDLRYYAVCNVGTRYEVGYVGVIRIYVLCMYITYYMYMYITRTHTAAVIVLQQSLASASTFVNEGSNVTACATIVYTYGGLPLASSVSVLFTARNGTAQSTLHSRQSLNILYKVCLCVRMSVCVSVCV